MSKSKGDWRWLHDEFTISRLAELLGVKRQLIDYWVRGRNDPDFLSTLKLARLVGSIEELERRAGVKIDINPLSNIEPIHPPSVLNDRNYSYIISVAQYLKYTSRFQELYAQAHAALNSIAGKDRYLTARLWFDIGYAQLMLGHPLDAVDSTRKARRMLPVKQESVLLADTHWLTGEALRVVGKLSEAYPHLEEAQKTYKLLDAKPSLQDSGPVWLEWDLGRYFAAYGKYDNAHQHFDRMEKIAKDIWLAEAEVIVAWSRGDIAEMKSEFGQAIASYFYAKELAKLTSDSFWETAAFWRTAEVYRKLGQFEKAIATAEMARGKFEVIGNVRMVAKCDCVLAASYLQTGMVDKAYDLYTNSIDIFTDGEDVPMERTFLLGLGFVDLFYESQKRTPDYRKPLQAFLEIDTKHSYVQDPYLAVYLDLACAESLRLAGYTQRALTRFDAVIKTSNKHGYKLEKAHALTGIAMTKLREGSADRLGCHEALKIYQELKSSWGQAQVLITRSLIEHELGGSGTHLLHKIAKLTDNNTFSYESQLIKLLNADRAGQKGDHVLLFVQAV